MILTILWPRPTCTLWFPSSPADKAKLNTCKYSGRRPHDAGRITMSIAPKGIFIGGVVQSIRLKVRIYWATSRSPLLQKLARHALSLWNLQLGHATPDIVQSKPERTNGGNLNGWTVMPVQSSSSLYSPIYCITDGTLTPQQWLEISKRLVAVSDQSSSDFTSTTARDQMNCFDVCLESAHTTSRC